MKRWQAWAIAAAGFAVIVAVSITLALIGRSSPAVVVIGRDGKAIEEGSGFDWELWALILTGLGTTALAVATALLALSTWRDVRASQEIAREAATANELARTEQARRPELTLLRDEDGIYSQLEGDGHAYVRLLVHNESGRRAARGVRVIVPYYRSWRNRVFTLGSPSLGWTSAPDAIDGSLVIFAGSSRVVDLGYFWQGVIHKETDRVIFDWGDAGEDKSERRVLRLALHDLGIGDRRDQLVPGPCVIRLIVGGDEAEAREYEVTVNWNMSAESDQAALDSLTLEIQPVKQ